MIIEKTYYDKGEIIMMKKTGSNEGVFIRKVRLSTTSSNKYYAKALLIGSQENIMTGEVGFVPENLTSKEGVTTSNIVIEETADVEEYFKNLVKFEGYEVLDEWQDSDFLAQYSVFPELSIEANKLLFLESEKD